MAKNNNTNNPTQFQHPSYKEAETVSKTEVIYQAPKVPSNEYDVELYKLQMIENDKERPMKNVLSIGALGIATVAAIGILKYIFTK